jgi:uncharacterized membrane protein
MYHEFSVIETLKVSWKLLKRNFAVIAVFSLVAFVTVFVLGFTTYNIFTDDVLASIAIIVLLIAVSFVFLGFIKLIFRLIDKDLYEFDLRDILPTLKMLASYLLLLIIVSALSVFLSHLVQNVDNELTQRILGVLIGIFFQFFFIFYFPICTCFIVDDASGPFESVGQSFELIKGNFFRYFILFVLIEIMLFIASLTLIGIIFVVPFVNIILVVAYRKLVYSHLDVDDDVSEAI